MSGVSISSSLERLFDSWNIKEQLKEWTARVPGCLSYLPKPRKMRISTSGNVAHLHLLRRKGSFMGRWQHTECQDSAIYLNQKHLGFYQCPLKHHPSDIVARQSRPSWVQRQIQKCPRNNVTSSCYGSFDPLLLLWVSTSMKCKPPKSNMS